MNNLIAAPDQDIDLARLAWIVWVRYPIIPGYSTSISLKQLMNAGDPLFELLGARHKWVYEA